ncbi:MAG TPA: hypothetical protein VN379_12970 [Sporomusa sp.]|nr:hypothetical protein [Sporomusa sp.]
MQLVLVVNGNSPAAGAMISRLTAKCTWQRIKPHGEHARIADTQKMISVGLVKKRGN